jgi:hypothetical protein
MKSLKGSGRSWPTGNVRVKTISHQRRQALCPYIKCVDLILQQPEHLLGCPQPPKIMGHVIPDDVVRDLYQDVAIHRHEIGRSSSRNSPCQTYPRRLRMPNGLGVERKPPDCQPSGFLPVTEAIRSVV